MLLPLLRLMVVVSPLPAAPPVSPTAKAPERPRRRREGIGDVDRHGLGGGRAGHAAAAADRLHHDAIGLLALGRHAAGAPVEGDAAAIAGRGAGAADRNDGEGGATADAATTADRLADDAIGLHALRGDGAGIGERQRAAGAATAATAADGDDARAAAGTADAAAAAQRLHLDAG
ncbi:hypothetical protein ABLE91_01100 [Aquabacter sp. CN5-332]|uniref:hypothetical protein n=1 Tax=Aquabacter sp. CN5-332 TaxID=3156608 RepID=UPI0032B41C55